MQRLDKAILAVSFGTTHEETRARTIDAIEADLAAAFPERKLYRGWTSGMILRILKKRADAAVQQAAAENKGITGAQPLPDSVEEALARMAADGVTDVLVQPTHIIAGEENDRMKMGIADFADRFDRIAMGRPLMSSEADLERLAKILTRELLDEEGILVLMGHGSADKPEANQIYCDLEQAFRSCGYDNVFVATVEGAPALEDLLEKLGPAEGRTVILAPLMTVAGDHARNDMAGDSEGSWKNRFEAAGFSVIPVLRGLGEYPAVREMFAEHARQAENR